MSENLYKLFTQEFKTNVELLLQQKSSLLRNRVRTESFSGDVAARVVNQFGVVEYKAPAGRFSPLAVQNPDMTGRIIQPQDDEVSILVDSFDRLKTQVNPDSGLSQTIMAGAGRLFDDVIIQRSIGSALIGTDTGTNTTESWSTSYDVADTFDDGSTSTGLTPAKLIEANRIMRHAHAFDDPADEAGKTLVIGSSSEANLLSQVQVTSGDYNGGMAPLMDGSMNGKRYLGWNLVVSERLPYASNVRTCIGWVPSGVILGIWQDVQMSVDRRVDLSSQPMQFYSKVSCGATRTQLGKVIKVKVADTITGDTTGTGGP